jgi:hypothetical protein
VGDSAFGGAVAAVATLFVLAALSALHYGPLRVSTPDIALLDSAHLPPRWAVLPLERVLEVALLAVQLPVLAAAAMTALCAVAPRTSPHGLHADSTGDEFQTGRGCGIRGGRSAEGAMALRGGASGALPHGAAPAPSFAADGAGVAHAWVQPYGQDAPPPIRLPSGFGAPSPGWRLDTPFTGAPFTGAPFTGAPFTGEPLDPPGAAGPSAAYCAGSSSTDDASVPYARRTGSAGSGEGSPSLLLNFSLPLEPGSRPTSVRGTRRKEVSAIIPEEGTLPRSGSRPASRPGSRPASRPRSRNGSRSPRRAESAHPGSPRAGTSPARGGGAIATVRRIPSPRRTESPNPRSTGAGTSRPLQGPTADKVRSRDRSPRHAAPSPTATTLDSSRARKPSPRRSEHSDRIIQQMERRQRASPRQVGRPSPGWLPPAGDVEPIGLGGSPLKARDGGGSLGSVPAAGAPESVVAVSQAWLASQVDKEAAAEDTCPVPAASTAFR